MFKKEKTTDYKYGYELDLVENSDNKLQYLKKKI
jgi:hypothetical protein